MFHVLIKNVIPQKWVFLSSKVMLTLLLTWRYSKLLICKFFMLHDSIQNKQHNFTLFIHCIGCTAIAVFIIERDFIKRNLWSTNVRKNKQILSYFCFFILCFSILPETSKLSLMYHLTVSVYIWLVDVS